MFVSSEYLYLAILRIFVNLILSLVQHTCEVGFFHLVNILVSNLHPLGRNLVT